MEGAPNFRDERPFRDDFHTHNSFLLMLCLLDLSEVLFLFLVHYIMSAEV